jgi:ABC-type Zn uptake system ZnuABC Zn-binding protein ZnuA
LASIAKEIGGDDFEFLALSKSDQDPHFVSPTPTLMKKTNEAVLFFEIGMFLEGWADEVTKGSGNPNIAKGAKGRIVVSQNIPKEEIPSQISRSEGDLHPEGNPHVWLDPIRVKALAENIATALKGVLPEKGQQIGERLSNFNCKIDKMLFGEELVKLVGSKKLSRMMLDGTLWTFLNEEEYQNEKFITKLGGWLKKAENLKGVKAIEYHRVWVYFCKSFGIELVGAIEEKPGIPPGPKHQKELVEKVKNDGVKLIFVDNFYSPKLANSIAKNTGAKVVILPNQIGGEKGTDDYFSFMDYLLNKITEALK